MLRHACAEERRRGQAARRLLRVRHGLLPQPRNESSEISFHVSLPCLQKRISRGTSLNMGPRAELHLSGCGTTKEREREKTRESAEGGVAGHGWGRAFRDQRWQRLLLWLLIAYRSQSTSSFSFVEVVFIHVGEVKPDWITQAKKLLLLPLNPAGQGPATAPSAPFSFWKAFQTVKLPDRRQNDRQTDRQIYKKKTSQARMMS